MPTLSDYGQSTVINKRTAVAKDTAQDTAHINALLGSIQTAQRSVTDPNVKALLSSQAKIIGSNMPIADNRLQVAGEVYKNAGTGAQTGYTNTGGLNANGNDVRGSAYELTARGNSVIPTQKTGHQVANEAENEVRALYSAMTNAGQSIDPAQMQRDIKEARDAAVQNKLDQDKTNASKNMKVGANAPAMNTGETSSSGGLKSSAGQQPSGSPSATPSQQQINESRQSVVDDLIAQGVSDPNQMLDYLNYDEQGNQIGDFTAEEIRQLMQGNTSTAKGGIQSTMTKEGTQDGTAAGGAAEAPSSPANFESPQDTAQNAAAMLGLSGLPPDIQKAYLPTILAAQQAAKRSGTRLDAQLGQIHIDDAISQSIFEQGQGSALESRERQLGLESKLYDLQKDREEETQRKKLSEIADAEAVQNAYNVRQQQLQRDQDRQVEKETRIYLQRTGQLSSSGGLDFMHEQAQKGTEAMNYIIAQAANSSKSFSNLRLSAINEYGLTMRTVDTNALATYDNVFNSYNSQLASLRKDRLLDKKGNSDAVQGLYDKYYTALDKADMDTANAYKDAHITLMDREKVISERNDANNKWSADYNFKVTNANNQMAFDRQKFTLDYQQKSKELEMKGNELELQDWQKQFTARSTIIDKVKTDIQTDKSVSQYETVYRPAWDEFSVAYSMPEGSAGREAAITSSFSKLIGNAYTADPSGVTGALSVLGIANASNLIDSIKGSNKLSVTDVDEMNTIAQALYSKAQERRNTGVANAMASVQKTNLQFTNDFFKITPEDVGIATTPMSHEAIQIIDTLPDQAKNKIVSYTLGKKSVKTTYEMQLRLQEADRMFYADTGQHLKVNSHFRTGDEQKALYEKSQAGLMGRAAAPGTSMHELGKAVDIDDTQWKIAQPYLVKAGLMQLPANIDQEDPGHFSLTGQ